MDLGTFLNLQHENFSGLYRWNYGFNSTVLLLQVKRTYSNGTYRAGAMRQISLVGAVDEEVGDYFPEFLGMLEESPFLKVRLQ